MEEKKIHRPLLFFGFFSLHCQPNPSSSEKCFITISQESPSSIGADATQALRTIGFPFPPNPSCLEPFLSSRLSRRGGVEVGEEREDFIFHTRSGLLSLFTLRLGNSLRFSRISCRKMGHGVISNCTWLRKEKIKMAFSRRVCVNYSITLLCNNVTFQTEPGLLLVFVLN